MLGLASSTSIYLCRDSADMRKNIDGLSSLVMSHLKAGVKTTGLFMFFNKRQNKVKIF